MWPMTRRFFVLRGNGFRLVYASLAVTLTLMIAALVAAVPAFAVNPSTYKYLGRVTGGETPSGLLSHARQVAFAPNGDIYVVDAGMTQVVDVFKESAKPGEYEYTGEQLTGFPVGSEVEGVTVDETSENVYVSVTKGASSEHGAVDVFDSSNTKIGQITEANSAPLGSRLAGVTINQSSGVLYATDKTGKAVDEFSTSVGNAYLSRLTTANGGPFGGPVGVAVNESSGHIYVADSTKVVVDEFNAAGTYLGNLKPKTAGVPELTAVAVDPAGYIYFSTGGENEITELSEGVVEIFNSGGTFIKTLTGSEIPEEPEHKIKGGFFEGPGGVAFQSSTGYLFVSDESHSQVDVFAGESTKEFKLKVEKTGTGSGTVTSMSAGINCGGTCEASYEENKEVTLTAAASLGTETTVKWTGCSSTTSTECKVKMTEAKTVKVEFTLSPVKEFKLKVEKTGTGSGTVTSVPAGINCGGTCEASYEENKEVTLTATASLGTETTVKWTGCSSTTSTECKVKMTIAKTVKVEFKNQEFKLKVEKAGTGTGIVSSAPAGVNCGAICEASFEYGKEVVLTATANPGSEFAKWSGCTTVAGDECKVMFTEARMVKVEFNLAPVVKYPLTITKNGTGTGSVECNTGGGPGACAAEYDKGTKVTLSATPTAGSTFAGWSGACSGTGACEVTLTAATSVAATFTAEEHTATTSTTPTIVPPPIVVPPPPSPVPPSNKFTAAVTVKGAIMTLKLILPGPGVVSAGSSGKDLKSARANEPRAGAATLKMSLTAAGKKALKKKRTLKLRVTIAFTPTGGSTGSIVKTVTLKAKGA